MYRYLALGIAAVAAVGCQSSNPYQIEGMPLPPAPAAAATHFDTSAYPAQVNFKDYRYWCWHNQALSHSNSDRQNSAHSLLAEQLEQQGLRPASSAQRCELKVQLSRQQRQRQHYYNAPYPTANLGYGYGGRHSYRHHAGYSGIGMSIPITPRSATQYYQVLTLSLTDAQTGAAVWRGQTTVPSSQNAQIDAQTLSDAFHSMLNGYR